MKRVRLDSPHGRSATEVLAALNVTFAFGLSDQEAELRLSAYGTNAIGSRQKVGLISVFVHQFQSLVTHMNRSQRRAAKAKEKVVKLARVVAMHEAGHAVARFLVTDDFGRPPEEMIGYIEVGLRHPVGGSLFNKSVTMVAQATTFGATFSAELQSVIAVHVH